MAESTKVQLKDVAGTPVYPVTTADQVKTADGGNVEARIAALEATFASGIRQKGNARQSAVPTNRIQRLNRKKVSPLSNSLKQM